MSALERDVAATRRDATAVDALGPVLRAEHSEEVPHPVAAPALRIAVWPRALAWTEALTLIAETHAPDNLYEDVRAHFSEAETVNLTMLIGAINAWNRLAIAFRAVHPVKAKAAVA